MGKVYDALQRAESERKRRAAGTPDAAAEIDWVPTAAAVPRARRAGRLGRWLARVRRDESGGEAGAINKRRITLLHPDSFAAEQFRTLRARIDSLATERPIRSIAVTSAVAGEGKTLAAVNLATVSGMGVGRRVLLVDCDLRKPKVAASLRIQPVAGLAEVLLDQAPLERAVHRVEGASLEVLPVRDQPSNPSELLASDRMRKLVEELGRSYDRVIFDTPASLALPDAKIVSDLSDGLVFVVRADCTPQEDVTAALDLLDRRRVLGVVLNGARIKAKRYGY